MTHRAKQLSRVMLKVCVVAGLLATFISSGITYAASYEGPIHIDDDGTPLIRESNTYGNSFPGQGRYWDYVVSNDNYTDIWSSDVLVYSPIPNPVITVIGSDLCLNNSQGMRAGDVPYSPAQPNGRRANDFRLYTFNPNLGASYGNGVSVAYKAGYWNYSAAATCRAKSITLTPTAYSPIDPGTGMYIYRINALANLASGGKFANSYHVVAPRGSIVTQSAVPAFSGFGMQASFPAPTAPAPNDPTPPDPFRVFSDIDIPFGPDCTLTTPTAVKSFLITDADNQGQYSVQPRPFNVSVLAFTQSTGVYRGMIPIDWVDVGAGGATDISGNRTIWEPTGSNQTGVRFDFTVQQGVVYRLRISRVYYNNTLQFRLPYDGAHYYIPCRQPTQVRPVVSMAPKPAENGVTIIGSSRIQNVGTSPVASQVNYTRRIWSDTNRNSAYDPGERLFGGTPQSGTVTVPAGAGSYNFPDWTDTADSGIHGGRVCINLGLSAAAPVTVQAPPIAVDCTDIGKKPKLRAAAGDVLVGGTFRNGAGVCTVQALSATNLQLRGSITTIAGVTYSSYADYAANSLGSISVFGTNGVNPQTPPANNMSFGNETPLGYFYSPAGSPPANPTRARCLNDPFAVFGSRGPFFTTASLPAGVDVATAGANIMYTGTTPLRVGASTPIPMGKKIIIYAPNANIDIVSNLAYSDGPYNSTDQLPQVVVLSGGGTSVGKITVLNNVTRIDGIYGTRGDFQTCDVTPLLNRCQQPFNLEGTVIAGGRVMPYRTGGAEKPNYDTKAEIFHLRPDLFLNQLPNPGSQTTVKTVDEREVPPRF